jgi:hypothetical protein
VAVGVTAIVAAVLAQPHVGTNRWLWTWLAEAVFAGVIAAISMARKAARANVSFRGVAARKFFISYFAPILAGGGLTFLLAREEAYALLPAMWLLLYGVSVVASGAYSIPVVPVMGVGFMAVGFAACVAPVSFGNILMGVGFGGVHVVFGYVIARRYGG